MGLMGMGERGRRMGRGVVGRRIRIVRSRVRGRGGMWR